MEITGKIKTVCPAKSGVSQKSGNPWKSQEYVIETSGDHPESCVFSVFGEDKIAEFNLQAGETVSVSLNLEAREFNGRWFNSLRAWRVMKEQSATTTNTVQPQYTKPVQPREQPAVSQTSEDELPF